MAAGSFHSGSLRRGVAVRVRPEAAWRVLGDIAGMPAWAAGVRSVSLLPGRRRGVGAARVVAFGGGARVEEHVVGWEPGRSFTYVAASGLPLRAYVATMSIGPAAGGGSRVSWQSYMCSRRTTRAEFAAYRESMGRFYSESLGNLRGLLEGRRRGRAGV